MINKRGISISERLNKEIEYAESIEGIELKDALAVKALGAVDIAVEFGLITYKEWEDFASRIFGIMQA